MRSTFLGLEVGRRAVMAQQTALDVTGHNIANANTTGYSRQVAEITTTAPFTYPSRNQTVSAGQIGTGSVVADIRRLHDEFIDNQIRDENRRLGYWESIDNSMKQIEVIVNEPSDTGLRGVLDQYWEAWQTVAESPENLSARASLVETARTLIDTIHHTYTQLTDLRADLNASVKAKVDEVNAIAEQIADLNKQIQAVTVSGQRPNDLIDQRGLLIENLSKIVNTDVYTDVNGMVTVTVGGSALVNGVDFNRIALKSDNGMYTPVWDINHKTQGTDTVLQMYNSEPVVNLGQGGLQGLIDARGPAVWPSTAQSDSKDSKSVTYVIDQLNKMTKALIEETNSLHKAGYTLNSSKLNSNSDISVLTNKAFFVPDLDPSAVSSYDGQWARDIALSSEVNGDVKNVAAASQPTYQKVNDTWVRINSGDGSNALAIADLKQAPLTGIDSTLDDYWRAAVAQIGVTSNEAGSMVDNQQVLLTQLDNKRQSVSGVSLDEEMANMIKYQHAYSAAARFITTVDEALDKIINQMGVVGR